MLLEGLKLQAEIKALRVIPMRDLKRLQELIWNISSRPIFRSIRIADDRYVRRHRLSISKLKTVISCGESCGGPIMPVSVTSEVLLCRLRSLVSVMSDVSGIASRCSTRQQAEAVNNQLSILSRFIPIEDEFFYASVKCLLRPIASTFTEGDKMEEGGNAPEQGSEEDEACYCWCREEDDGSPMIGCDDCGEWFHNRCVGISKKHPLLENSAYRCISCSISRQLKYKYAW